MTSLRNQPSPDGSLFQKVHAHVLNPKSITMGQLYGEFDMMTHEWTDGILSTLIRHGVSAGELDKRWYIFDGPVDAVWIENMNTVLDDNKKLCLSSGEIIKLTEEMTMIFEVADLAVASPATVSRCGMVYLEPGGLGLQPFIDCWVSRLPDAIYGYREKLNLLFATYLEESINFIRTETKEVIPTTDGQLCFNFLRLMDCFFKPFTPTEQFVPDDIVVKIGEAIESWFLFTLIWSVGATCNNEGRRKFDMYLRAKLKKMKVYRPFPEEGLVYDYRFDDSGFFNMEQKEEDDEELNGPKEKKVSGSYSP
ncbi:unnamed protein product [Protopolystoma xenopodis]|uniref:Dynein heavy chain AAA 5 extension domain-containing protein n=1 Tax=Protopolystoma xenopodis TaxID=117903 RepID=A0A448WAK0_9PLAT|nr:unnamed protein product [Protopolystoma xenopodis]